MQALARFEQAPRRRVGHAPRVDGVETGAMEGSQEPEDRLGTGAGAARPEHLTREADRTWITPAPDSSRNSKSSLYRMSAEVWTACR